MLIWCERLLSIIGNYFSLLLKATDEIIWDLSHITSADEGGAGVAWV